MLFIDLYLERNIVLFGLHVGNIEEKLIFWDKR